MEIVKYKEKTFMKDVKIISMKTIQNHWITEVKNLNW